MLHNITSTFPTVFSNKGGNKPHSNGYREFCTKWTHWKTFYEICGEKIEKVRENYQLYLTDYLQFLSYLIDKNEAEKQEDEFQEQRRKLQRRR